MAQPQYEGSSVNRTFQTRDDRFANQTRAPGEQRQRSRSIHHYYDDGSVVREHVHDNARSGGQQFSHIIGGWSADGTQWGR